MKPVIISYEDFLGVPKFSNEQTTEDAEFEVISSTLGVSNEIDTESELGGCDPWSQLSEILSAWGFNTIYGSNTRSGNRKW